MAVIALDCLDLAQEYRLTDVSEASEAELARQMEEADLNDELCGRALRENYRGAGGAVMASHLARSLTIHSLRAELALSERFDEMAGYCEILAELTELLRADLNELLGAFERPEELSERDLATLRPLTQLTIQSLEICALDYAETCE
jgi:hypothetical protein